MKQRVVFLHRKGMARAGSKIMRCDQLRDICEAHLGDEFDFRVRPMPPIREEADIQKVCGTVRGAIVILLKGAAVPLGDQGMEALRKSARGICIDYVDADAYRSFSPWADVHIGASHAGCRLLSNVLKKAGQNESDAPIMLLTHHADPRLDGLHIRHQQELRGVYMGHPSNVFIPPDIQGDVHVLKYENDLGIGGVFDNLLDFNLHYAVRAPALRPRITKEAKPFTKGFIAAAVGANILVPRATDDAVIYLGEDYPFLLENTEPNTIVEGLHQARGLFGTSAWSEATQRMEHIREITSPGRIANEMKDILALFQ